MLKKYVYNKLTTIIALTVVILAAYYILLYDNYFHASISSIISYSHNLDIKSHMVVLGILPIYIAAIIFGAAVCGLYLGAAVEHLLLIINKKNCKSSQSV